MKILVAMEEYIGGKKENSHRFVHVRNLYYKANGIDVEVLNFSTEQDYVFEDIRVITYNTYKHNRGNYDILVCHQPNIKHFYFFLKRYGDDFKRFIFFFHGHEVLKTNKTYPEPYYFVHSNILKKKMQDIYDDIKLCIWRRYYPSVIDKSNYIFVSKWMLDEFLKWTKIPYELIKKKCSITYNGIGKLFECTKYNYATPKKYDFLTIRNHLDGSKYSIDIVNDLAHNNPTYTFVVVGRGHFFEYFNKASNLIWLDKVLSHDEIVEMVQESRCGLMPTRTDAQGLMMCEMASTGMPLITSDISVCHEIFQGFSNVRLIDNSNTHIDIGKILVELEANEPYTPNNKFYNDLTCKAELNIIICDKQT